MTSLKELDIDNLAEICKGMSRRDIEDMLIAHTKTGKRMKEVPAIKNVLKDMCIEGRKIL